MSTVNPNIANQQISTSFANAARDGQITHKEARELNAFIDSTSLPDKDKSAAKSMIAELKKATTGSFLFFSWKSKVTPSEMQGLQNLAQTNTMAKTLLQSFSEANPVPAPTRSRDRSRVSAPRQSAAFNPGTGIFGNAFASEGTGSTRRSGRVQPLSTPGRTPSWIVSQNGTGLSSASGDCGPASAAMVARRFGFNTNMNSREAVQAARSAAGVTSRRRGAWAIDENEVTKAIQAMTGGTVRETADTGLLRAGAGNRDKIISTLRQSISQGDMPILLTGSRSTSSRHYMVVTDVKSNGNLVMADPAGGQTWEMTPEMLDKLMQKANRRGGTRVMAYNQ
jgi:hypothetical protein